MGKPRGKAFAPGNTLGAGRPKGSRNKKTLWFQEMLEEHGEALMKKCMVDALHGDRHSMRLCIERLLPPQREGRVRVSFPRVHNLASVDLASERVIRAVTSGEITPADGQMIAGVLEQRRRVIETLEFENRLQALEQNRGKQS
jgi:hypothetical protein